MVIMFFKEKIVMELDDRYFTINDLQKAVVTQLKNEGKACQVIDLFTLLIDNKKYSIQQRNLNMSGVPVQQVILTQIEN
jgi:hypothetical protein